MARIVGGPYVSGQVLSRETGSPLGGVSITVSSPVYTDPEMSAATTTVVTDGNGRFSFYAAPGVYTLTAPAPAAAIEPVKVLGEEEGTGLRYLKADTTGITDGQILAWSTALGRAVPVAPPGSAEVGYVKNDTTTGLALAVGGTASGDIAGVTFIIGPDPRAIWVVLGCTFQQTVVGDGSLTLTLVDMTGGGAGVGLTPATSFRLPNTVAAGVKTVVATSQPIRLGVLAVPRTYKVTASVSAPSGTPAVNILNTVAFPSWMRAMA